MNSNMQGDTLVIDLEGRIDSSNADRIGGQIDDCIAQNNARNVELNCANLEYISSAGLRVIMRLLKTMDYVSVTEASNSVYEVFDITGIAQLMSIRRALRVVDTSNLTALGSGVNGTVYRLTRDEMIKVFKPTETFEHVESERQASREAFLLGIPCAIPFDTVRCGEGFGTIYECLNAKTLAECICENPDSLTSYATQSAKLLKQLHQIEIPGKQMPPAKRVYERTLDDISYLFEESEMEELHILLDAIPSRNRFIHNDYHPKNIMVSDGELMLIDLGGSGAGNPLFDLIHTYLVCVLAGRGCPGITQQDKSIFDLTYNELDEFWGVFLDVYCDNERRSKMLGDMLRPWGWFMYLTSAMCHPKMPEELKPGYVKKLRDLVFPRTTEMLYSVRDMDAMV